MIPAVPVDKRVSTNSILLIGYASWFMRDVLLSRVELNKFPSGKESGKAEHIQVLELFAQAILFHIYQLVVLTVRKT
jgi:hypothetical protein